MSVIAKMNAIQQSFQNDEKVLLKEQFKIWISGKI